MVTKIHQVLALEKGVKRRTHDEITHLHHTVTREQLLSGLSRVYTPKDDDGEVFPPESTPVRVKATDALQLLEKSMSRLFDITLVKDTANMTAKADIVVDGRTIVEDAPVSYLLFLEKQLTDLRTFFRKMPVLEPGIRWTFDKTSNLWKSDGVQTTKSKKVPRSHVKYEATEHHPAQVEMYMEDVTIGTWTTTRYSGALPQETVDRYVQRVEQLLDAVKSAREEANSGDVTDREVGAAVFEFIYAD